MPDGMIGDPGVARPRRLISVRYLVLILRRLVGNRGAASKLTMPAAHFRRRTT